MTFFDTSWRDAFEASVSYGLSSYEVTGTPFENVQVLTMAGANKFFIDAIAKNEHVILSETVEGLNEELRTRDEFVAKLRAIRERAIAKGMKLKSLAEIRSEIDAARNFGE